MRISLPSDVESSIREKIASGRYADEADVIRAAMALLERQQRAEWLISALAEGEIGEPIEYTSELMDRSIAESEANAARGNRFPMPSCLDGLAALLIDAPA